MPIAVTPTRIAAAVRQAAGSAKRIVINDPREPGLCLRITSRGIRTWNWLGRDQHGRVRRFSLGRHPYVTLAEARRRARRIADQVRQGRDPVQEARAKRNTAGGHTFRGLLDLYAKQVGSDIKSWAVMRRQIERVFGRHLPMPLANLTAGALQMTADGYAAKHSASFGVRCLMPVLRWAAQASRRYVAHELLQLKQPTAKPRPRDRVLSLDELARLLPVLRQPENPYAAASRLILLTAARRSEVARARWRDIDFPAATWTLPETKNGTQHIIPLPRQALALLRARLPEPADPSALVFTSSGKALNGWDYATEQLQAASGTEGWTRHDLRRTVATMLGEMGVLPDIVEAALNHVTLRSQIAGTYNKSRYRPQVAEALQRWADRADLIEVGGGKIVAFSPAFPQIAERAIGQ